MLRHPQVDLCLAQGPWVDTSHLNGCGRKLKWPSTCEKTTRKVAPTTIAMVNILKISQNLPKLQDSTATLPSNRNQASLATCTINL